jgi:large subunit ribosomal protein L6
MSRVAKKPIELPAGIEISVQGQALTVKGSKGSFDHKVHRSVSIQQDGNVLTFAPRVSG